MSGSVFCSACKTAVKGSIQDQTREEDYFAGALSFVFSS